MAMRGLTLVPSNVTRTVICVNEFEGPDFSGLLYNPYMEAPAPFGSAIEILNIMEAFFDRISFPQAYLEDRVFAAKTKTPERKKAESEVKRYMSDESISNERGKKATFVIQVQFRQNATWQGSITWTEEKKMQRFRSTLEMIKLMDEALGNDETGDAVVWGD